MELQLTALTQASVSPLQEDTRAPKRFFIIVIIIITIILNINTTPRGYSGAKEVINNLHHGRHHSHHHHPCNCPHHHHHHRKCKDFLKDTQTIKTKTSQFFSFSKQLSLSLTYIARCSTSSLGSTKGRCQRTG